MTCKVLLARAYDKVRYHPLHDTVHCCAAAQQLHYHHGGAWHAHSATDMAVSAKAPTTDPDGPDLISQK